MKRTSNRPTARFTEGLYTRSLLKASTQTEKPPRICADLRGSALIRVSLFVLVCINVASAQEPLSGHVTISISGPGQIRVEAMLSEPMNSWSFRNAYAGVLGVAERIEDFRAVDADVRQVAVGEYRSEQKARRISYTVKLSKPTLADVS